LLTVLAPERLGDQRRGTDAERLREREHQEREVAGERHTGDRLLPERADEIQVGQEVERLEGGGERDEARELQHVSAHRAAGQVLHVRACL